MKKLVLLLGALALIGCGEKKESSDNGAAGNDAGAGESIGGESADTSASPESQLIGYWALNAEKIIKAIEADPPDGATAEELKELGPALREGLREWTFIMQFAEGGQLNHYNSNNSDIEVGTYSLLVDGEKDAPTGINAKLDSHGEISMVLTGATLRINQPAGEQLEFPLLATQINAAEAKDRIQEVNKVWAEDPRNLRGGQPKARSDESKEVTEPVEPTGDKE